MYCRPGCQIFSKCFQSHLTDSLMTCCPKSCNDFSCVGFPLRQNIIVLMFWIRPDTNDMKFSKEQYHSLIFTVFNFLYIIKEKDCNMSRQNLQEHPKPLNTSYTLGPVFIFDHMINVFIVPNSIIQTNLFTIT